MDLYKRYIPCKCLQVGNDFIPFWELTWTKNEDYGEGFYKNGESQWDASYSNLVDCYWDSKNKKIILGIIKDVYPSVEKLKFKIDEVVLIEVASFDTFKLDKIAGVEYNEYETQIVKVKKLDSYELKWYFSDEEIKSLNLNDLYEIRKWKPTYITESGFKTIWEHQIKKFIK